MSRIPHISRGLREVEDVLRDAKEIRIPFQVAKVRYGGAVAAILDQLVAGSAATAKDKPPEDFKWYLMYTQPEDPNTTDEDDFVRRLSAETRIFLVCRGFKWKGVAELKAEQLPEQVRARYEERARLLCGDNSQSPQNVLTLTATRPRKEKTLEDDVNQILTLVAGLSRHNVESGYIRIIEVALKHLKAKR